MRIAITADLHWGHNRVGDEATAGLVHFLDAHVPDVLLLGGDQGTQDHFGECLDLFAAQTCPKGLVPGNHDIWVADNDVRGDSLYLYRQHLPAQCAAHGFHYLDQRPLLVPEAGLAVVGSINWYDYSWSLDRLRREVPNWRWHVENKAFTRGRHNDARFVRWSTDDVAFTRQVVDVLAGQLRTVLQSVEKVLVLTHHPACYAVGFPRAEPPRDVDGLLWDALCGNAGLEVVLREHRAQLAGIFSGHTHRAHASHFDNVPAFNIGGDYHFKRLVLLDWPDGTIETHTFGDPSARR